MKWDLFQEDKMTGKTLRFVYIIVGVLLYSCKSTPSQEVDNISLTPTKTPRSTLNNTAAPELDNENPIATKIIQADIKFDPSASNKIPPDDILTEVGFGVGGGWGLACPEYGLTETEIYEVGTEFLTKEYIGNCIWKDGEEILVTVQNPNGDTFTQKVYAEEFMDLNIRFGIDAPTGVYKYTLEGGGKKALVTVNLKEPDGARLYRMDATHLLLYNFKPSESVNLYYYSVEESNVGFRESGVFGALGELVGWQNYTVNPQGQLVIEIPADTGYSGDCMGRDDFFTAIGEESGEIRLFADCLGPKNAIGENTIIRSHLPRMSNFSACIQPCNGSDSTKNFPEASTKIYVEWDYENIPYGSRYTREWRLNGKRWISYDCTWTGPESGRDSVKLTEPKGLHSGEWELRIEVNGMTLLVEQITLAGNWTYWDPAGILDSCYGTTN